MKTASLVVITVAAVVAVLLFPISTGTATTGESIEGEDSVFLSFCTQIGEAMLKGVAGKVGAFAFTEILTALEGPNPSTDELLNDAVKQIEAFIDERISEQTLDNIKAHLNAYTTFLEDTYEIDVKAGKSKQTLTSKLEPYEQKLLDAISRSSEGDVKAPGLGVFIVAVNTAISYYQECAFRDPSVTNPVKSLHGKTITLLIEQKHPVGLSQASDNLNYRLSEITEVKFEITSQGCHGWDCWIFCQCSYQDTFTGNTVKYQHSGRTGCNGNCPEADNSRSALVDSIKQSNSYSDLVNSMAAWTELAEHPIPQKKCTMKVRGPVEIQDDYIEQPTINDYHPVFKSVNLSPPTFLCFNIGGGGGGSRWGFSKKCGSVDQYFVFASSTAKSPEMIPSDLWDWEHNGHIINNPPTPNTVSMKLDCTFGPAVETSAKEEKGEEREEVVEDEGVEVVHDEL